MYVENSDREFKEYSMDRTLNQDTYNRFRRDIMTFALKPGDQVSAAKLADRYQVSRTPAREALIRLETEGLVVIYPQSKSVISKINVHRARQEWFIRKTLELGMVDSFIEKVTERDIELMEEYNRHMTSLKNQPRSHDSAFRYLSCDNDFHAVTYMVAGERLSAEVISNTMAHYNRIRLLVDLDALLKDRTVSTHNKLIGLARSRDRAGYREMLNEHLGHIIKDIENMWEKYPDYFEM